MIGALTGKVFTRGRNPLILMVAGVGYAVHLPARLASRLIKGRTETLFIHTHVRDDALDLFGFSTLEELDLFNLLLEVPGVGPRTGLSVIDQGVEAIVKAVSESDVDFFQTIPRLGKKNAQKIIIELKSKLGGVRDLDLSLAGESETTELLEALTSMGFEKKEALGALRKVAAKKVPLAQKIKLALQYLARS